MTNAIGRPSVSGVTLETTTFSKDANGNVTRIDVDTGGVHDIQNFAYSARNQLDEVLDGSQQVTHDFLESAIGPPHRIEQGSDWLDLTYTQDLQPLRRTEISSGSVTNDRLYVYVGGQLLGFWDDGDTNPTFAVNDQVGRPFFSINDAGQVAWSSTSRPFGEVITTAGSSSPLLGYPGQVDIGEDWMVNGWRSYSPRTGRYLQPDPILSALSRHAPIPDYFGAEDTQATDFSYVVNNPLGFVDTMGLAHCAIPENHLE